VDTLDQTLDLLHTALTAHGRTSDPFDLFDRIGTTGDSIDDIHLGHIHADTEVLVQILFQDRR
jgi:hypothetical protein